MSDKPTKEIKQGEFCWNELITRDPAAAKEFYSNLFDWEAKDIDMGDSVYTIFKNEAKDVAGLLEMPADKTEVPPHWLSYINVDDVAAMTAKAESLGATVLVPVKDVGEFGKLSMLKDPTGAKFAFWQNTKSC